MRFFGLAAAGLAGVLVLPAAADGYERSAPATSYTFNSQTSSTSPCATSCCCGHYVRTYTTAPVIRRYTRTYTRLVAPDCYHTSHVGHAHSYSDYETRSSYTAEQVTGGYAYEYSYGYDTRGTGSYGSAYYTGDEYGDTYDSDGYYAAYPSSSYGAELSVDREAPWNAYHR